MFTAIESTDAEQVIALHDAESGLRGFIAVHDTTRGPAFGGIRCLPYASESTALDDALALGRAMTLKLAAANLPGGGGKIVLIRNDRFDQHRREAFAMLARHVQALGGRFITARDIGTTTADTRVMREHTVFVADEREPPTSATVDAAKKRLRVLPPADGQTGDLNLATAMGVLMGILGALDVRDPRGAGSKTMLSFTDPHDVLDGRPLDGLRVAVQGLGGVGLALARLLVECGATVIGADVDAAARARASQVRGAAVLDDADAIYDADAHVFAPCAIGGLIDVNAARRLHGRIVCGSANNPLAAPAVADALAHHDVRYCPDILVTAGAVILGVYAFVPGVDAHGKTALDRINEIRTTTARILQEAERTGTATSAIAEAIARARLKRPRRPRHLYVPPRPPHSPQR